MENLHSAAEAETPLSPLDHVSSADTAIESHEIDIHAEAVVAEGADQEEGAAIAKVKTLHPRAVLNILADRYPAAFHADGRLVKPLAVGVLQELRALREGEEPLPVTVQDLRRALRYYTQGAAYHRAVARGDARINLLGEPVAEVTEEQKEHAAAKLVELEPKLPKRPERPERAPRPARVGDSAPEAATAAEAAAGTGSEERPRRPRNPMDKRPAGRAPRRDAGRDAGRDDRAPRNENRSRPPREEQRAAPAPVAAESKNEAATVVLDMNDKLNLLVAKFGR
jgi:sRNA-binding protein